MLDITPDWTGGIDDFVTTANTWLPRLLPLDRAARPKDEVNARLVRHYTTVGLLSLPTREGREARYDRRHLLQLLALRRVMADGLSGKALYSLLSGQDDDGLTRLAQEGVTPELEATAASKAPSDALSYLQNLKARQNLRSVQQPEPEQSLEMQEEMPELSRSLAIQPLAFSLSSGAMSMARFSAPAGMRMPKTLSPATPLWRITPRPGLEITLGSEFKLPQSEVEWTQLLAVVRRELSAVDRP